MNILEHPIYKDIYDLCREIEKLPASEQQTKCVVMASALEKPASELVNAIKFRSEQEARAHILFAEPLSTGIRLAHTPDQCNPLGFVEVIRHALDEVTSALKAIDPENHALRSPHIFMPRPLQELIDEEKQGPSESALVAEWEAGGKQQ